MWRIIANPGSMQQLGDVEETVRCARGSPDLTGRLSAMKRIAAAILAGALLAVYRARLRAAVLSWGATAQEAAADLPGDELLADADGISTIDDNPLDG